MQGGAIPMFKQMAIIANKEIKLQIVVRALAFRSLKHATFTAAIPTAKEQTFDAACRNKSHNCFLHQFAAMVETLFEGVIAIHSVTRAWTRRALHPCYVRRGELGRVRYYHAMRPDSETSRGGNRRAGHGAGSSVSKWRAAIR